MSIAASCKCGKTFKVKDEYAGKKGKCPECGDIVVIPKPAAARPAAPASPGAPRAAAPTRAASPTPARPAKRPAPPPPPSSSAAWDGPDLDSLGELEATGTALPDEASGMAPPPLPPSGRGAPAAAPQQKACSSCGSIISAFARVCEHCGASVAGGGPQPAGYATPKKYQAASGDDMGVVDWILCLMCPVIGYFVGKSRGNDKMQKIAGIVILINIVAAVLKYVLAMNSAHE